MTAHERAWRLRAPRGSCVARCRSYQRSNSASCGACTTAAITQSATYRSCSQSPGRPFTGRLPGRRVPNSSEDFAPLISESHTQIDNDLGCFSVQLESAGDFLDTWSVKSKNPAGQDLLKTRRQRRNREDRFENEFREPRMPWRRTSTRPGKSISITLVSEWDE